MFDPLRIGAVNGAADQRARAGATSAASLLATFTSTPHVDAFQDSISNSVAAFYADFDGDARPAPRRQLRRRSHSPVRAHRALPPGSSRRRRRRRSASRTLPPLAPADGPRRRRHRVHRQASRRSRWSTAESASACCRAASAAARHRAFRACPSTSSRAATTIAPSLDRALDGIDVVYHLAKSDGQRWADYLRDDVEPTRVLAEAALAHGVKRFIYTGTIDSYYSADARRRDRLATRRSIARIGEPNLYARSKAACEALLQSDAPRARPAARDLPPGSGHRRRAARRRTGASACSTPTRACSSGATARPSCHWCWSTTWPKALALGMTAPGIEGQTFLLTDEPLLSAQATTSTRCRGQRQHVSPRRPRRSGSSSCYDVAKETVKHLVRHPNRRVPQLP